MDDKKEVWLAVKEAYNLLGVSQQAMAKRIKSKKYTTKMVSGNGGKQYRILLASLPQTAQDRYYASKAQQVMEENTVALGTEMVASEAAKVAERHRLREQGLERFGRLPQAKQAQAKSKQLLIHAYQQHIREHQLGKVAGLFDFCEQLNAGQLPLHATVMETVPVQHGVVHLNPGSFKRWVYGYEKLGLIALANDHGKRAGQSLIEGNVDLKRYVLGFIQLYPHAMGKKIAQALAADRPELRTLSEVSINRYIARWKAENAQIWTYITHPDKWKNVYMSAQGSHFDKVFAPNDMWEMDSTPDDHMLSGGRYAVVGCIDLYTRRVIYYVSKTSTAHALCMCLRKAILAWGVPKCVRTDNGKDYLSDHFMAVLRALDIAQELCIKFASEEKGTVERQFRTMSHGILELMYGFLGHNVVQAQQLRSMQSFSERVMKDHSVQAFLEPEQLQASLDKWGDHIYAQNPHSGLKGKTPTQVTALYSGSLRRIGNIRALDTLLAQPAGTCTIRKKGIRFKHYDYIGAFLTEYAGQKVTIKYDEQDIGKLFVYCEGEFIGIAQCADLTDISRQEVAIVAKKQQKKKLNQQAKELRAFKKEVATNIPELVMNHRIDNADNVVRLPHHSVEHNTPALAQAATAERVASGLVDEVVHTPEVMAGKAKVIEFLNTAPEVNILAMNDSEKYRYWQGLEAMCQAGDGLSDKEMNFYTRFQNTDTFRVIRETLADLAANSQ